MQACGLIRFVRARDLLGLQSIPTDIYSTLAAPTSLGEFAEHSWSDTELEVVFDKTTVTLTWGKQWVKYLPTTIRRRSNVDGKTLELLGPHSHEEPFRLEWIHFFKAISQPRDPSGPAGKASRMSTLRQPYYVPSIQASSIDSNERRMHESCPQSTAVAGHR